MKFKKEEGSWFLYFNKEQTVFAHFTNDWKQLFGKYNWYTFHILYIYFEKDCMLDGYEFEFVILGLGIRIRINTADENNEIMKRIKEIEDGTVKLKKINL